MKSVPDKDFAEDVIEELLEKLTGGTTLSAICKDKRMPGRTTIYNWIEDDEDFAERFHGARAKGVHALADQCVEIADEKVEKDDSVAVQNKRVRIDTRLRLAGKWLPSLYGEKLDLTSGGEKLGLSAEIEASRRRAADGE